MPKKTRNSEPAENFDAQESKPKRGISTGFKIFAFVFFLGTVLQNLSDRANLLRGDDARFGCVGIGFVCFVFSLTASLNPKWRRFLSSNRFSVPAIFSLTFLSILGTVILQSQPEAVLQSTYSSKPILALIKVLFLHDIFHSFGFSGSLGICAGSLVITVLRKRKLTVRYLGTLAAHIGLLLILLGTTVGNIGSVKGRLNLHEGEAADRFIVGDEINGLSDNPLGFKVRLDDFKLIHYEPEYRLMVFEMKGDQEERLLSIEPGAEANNELSPFGIKVVNYWPDHDTQMVVTPVDAKASSKLPTISALSFRDLDSTDDEPKWVFDEGQATGGNIVLNKDTLVFFWDKEKADSFVAPRNPAETTPHHLVISDGTEIPIQVGQRYPLVGSNHQIEIDRALKDFVFDSKSGAPIDRSDRPNNPAIEISILDENGVSIAKKWLFAKFPSFHGSGENSLTGKLRYLYKPDAVPQNASVVVVGETAEAWTLDKNVVTSKQPIAVGKTIKLGITKWKIEALLPRVRYSTNHYSRSEKPSNPLALIAIKGIDEPVFLTPNKPIRISDRKVVVFAPKETNNVKDYVSTVSVLEEDRRVLTKKIEVNHPLTYKGYSFYQNDYRPNDPTFSGFQVVRDPGLPLVYLGFITNLIGVLISLFLSKLFASKKRASVKA